MKKKIIPLLIVIVVVTAAIVYFEILRHGTKDRSRIEGMGTIEVTEIDISSKIAGRVLALPKPEGASVKEGDLLVKLEYDELQAQLYSAAANLSNAKKSIRRMRALYKSGSVSKKDFDNAETAYRVAQAFFDQVTATIKDAVIYSPLDGVVLDTNVDIGETAFPGTPIITIADLTKTWIYIYVNERMLGRVKIGQHAAVHIDSYPDKIFKGQVTAISSKAEFTPKTIQTKDERIKLVFAVKIAINNPDKVLKPGMPADAEIIVEGVGSD